MGAISFATIERHLRHLFGWVAGFSLIINVLMLTSSIYMMQVFDRVLASGSLSTLIYLSVIAIGALVIMGALDFVRAKALIAGGAWMERKLAPPVLRRLIDQPQLRAEHRAEPVRDLGVMRSYLSGPGMMYLFDAPWVPVYLAVIYLLHPLLGHIALAGTVVLFLLALANDRVSHTAIRQAGQANAKAMRQIDAGLRNAEVIDAMGLVPGFLRRWAETTGVAIAQQTMASDWAAVIAAGAKVFRQVIQITVLGVGAWLVIRHDLTGGAMIAGSIILGRALAPVEQAIGTWRQTVQALEARRRLRAFFDRPDPRPDSMPLPAPQGRLSVEGLVYTLPGTNRPLIKGVSFALPPGEALAIVGPSAAGKSTLARLLVGVLKPTAGSVRLDSGDVYLWNREDFGRHLGYLPQDVELFDGTIRDNIARLTAAEPEAIVEAAQLAQCHEMVLRLEQGYETEIGEGGVRLSGGQRQRIGLARALFGKPKLIVLDEPNANLDTEGEAALNRAVAAMKANGSTVVVIGHRPSTLSQVDKVLVLVNGAVERFGPRQEVLEALTRRTIQAVPGGASARPKPPAESAEPPAPTANSAF